MNISWKKLAWLNAKKENQKDQLDIAICPETEKEIYFLVNNKKFPFESFGTCCECYLDFHHTALHLSSEMDNSDWPIEYMGAYCEFCFNKYDEDEEEEVELVEDPDDDIEEYDGYIEEII